MSENAGAFVGGGSSGEDVIDEDDPFSAEFFQIASFDPESSAKIREALLTIELGLGLRGADPLE